MPWALPFKLAIAAILGAFGAAGVLRHLSEYASYSYALYFGIRPPLEGILYLKAAVALGSLLLSGAAVFTIVNFIAWSTVLFTPAHYSTFLRTVGYGGGLSIIVELHDDKATLNTKNVDLYLMLRTTDALILLDKSNDRFIDIPREQVRQITHKTGGLRQLQFYLPAHP